jgi:hypothetical protein
VLLANNPDYVGGRLFKAPVPASLKLPRNSKTGSARPFRRMALEQLNAAESWSLTIGETYFSGDEGAEPEFRATLDQVRSLVQIYQGALAQCDKTASTMVRLGLDAEALRMAKERPSR